MAYSGGRTPLQSSNLGSPMNPLSYMRLFPRSMRKYIICYLLFWGFVSIYFIYTGFAVYLFQMAYGAVFGATAKPLHDVLAFFPEVKNEASRITWSHATNSKKLLHEALNGPQPVMVIESDVLMKGGGTSQQELLPIMAHPPAVDSDLTFDEYLATVVASGNGSRRRRPVGIKLDFKAIEVVELCLQKVARQADRLPGPLIVNADILPGPGAPPGKTPIDHRRFLRLHSELTPTALLSIGWLTSYSDDLHYAWDHVIPMWQLVSKMQQQSSGGRSLAVTYPVRSALLADSLLQLRWLCDAAAAAASLTVWTASADPAPDAGVLRRYRAALGAERLFVDLPGFPADGWLPAAGSNDTKVASAAAGRPSPLPATTSQTDRRPLDRPDLRLRPADWTIVASPPSAGGFGVGAGCVAGSVTRLALQSRLTQPAPTALAPLRLSGDAHFAVTSQLYQQLTITLAGGDLRVVVDPSGDGSVTAIELTSSSAADGATGSERQRKRAASTTAGGGRRYRLCWYNVTHAPDSLTVEVSFHRDGRAETPTPLRLVLTDLLPGRSAYAPIVAIVTVAATAASADAAAAPAGAPAVAAAAALPAAAAAGGGAGVAAATTAPAAICHLRLLSAE